MANAELDILNLKLNFRHFALLSEKILKLKGHPLLWNLLLLIEPSDVLQNGSF